MNSPLVSIIVLNWNGKCLLEECLQSLFHTNYPNIEIIVVDNGSTDGSVSMVQKYPQVTLIALKENVGYTGGNNVGLNAFKGDYAVTINNDIIVDPAWLDNPVLYLEKDPSLGAISCRQMNYFERTTMDTIFLHPTRFMLPERMGHGKTYDPRDPAYSEPGIVLGASGASAIYRKKMLDEIGLFEESFFIYQEECDLQMRAFLSGWKCLYVPSSVVYHKESATMKKHNARFFHLHERNRIWFIYRNFPLSWIMEHMVTILYRELRTAINIIVRNRMPLVYLKARIQGFAGMRRFRDVRKKNMVLFKNHADEYRFLLNNKKAPYARLDGC